MLTSDQIKDLAHKADNDKTYVLYTAVCRNCSRRLGAHMANDLNCPVNGKNGNSPAGNGYTKDQFFPTTNLSITDDWLCDSGSYIKCPLSFHPSSSSKWELTGIDLAINSDIKSPVKNKVYRHECPCGLIKCEYHEVIV